MKTNIKSQFDALRRPVLTAVACMLAMSGVVPAVLLQNAAYAATQVSTRSIQLSDSRLSATGVTYKVTFTPNTSTAKSIVIDFCQDSPIIGAACDAINGVTFGSPSASALAAGNNLPGTWTLTTSGSTAKLAGTGTALTSGTAYSFEITNVKNPTGYWNGTTDVAGTPGSFYARVYTYGDTTFGSTTTAYSNAATPGDYKDYGGFALSTTNAISVSATVMETLTFCVSGAAPGPSCGKTGQAVTSPAVVLGHGSPATIDSTAVDTNASTTPTYTQLSTNALTGASVSMKTTNTCSGLSRNGGTDSCPIPGLGTAGSLTAGNAGFGLQVSAGTGGTGTVSGIGNYGTGGSTYYMGANVTSTYGDPIEQSTAATANVNNQLTFATTANTTTPAGVYTTNEILIATGKF